MSSLQDEDRPFSISPVLQSTLYAGPIQTYLSANPSVTNPMGSAAIFYHHPSPPDGDDNDDEPHLLLLQRAPTDTLPLKWELPGGSVDVASDPSMIHGAVRELREETGLVATHVVRELGVQREFYEHVVGENGETRKMTWRMAVYEMVVDVGDSDALGRPRVALAPDEHARYLWCTEGDIRAERCGQVALEFTDPTWRRMMLRAFELHRSGACRR